VLCFQYREDADKVMEVLPKRFAKYGLTLHPEKTRLVDFGRYAEEHAKRQGQKPATFDFLGFTHILCTQPEREVHSECADHEETASKGPDGSSRLVPGAPP
jgi:hypothetical protein